MTVATSTDGELFEVFVRPRRGVSHIHAGSVHAASAALALQYGRDLFTRRLEGVSIWVVPASAVTASQPDDADGLFAPAEDKDFRYPGYYELPDGIENI
ncbi:MAG: 1,2-phenylacetyl-CoA epoxidase subunit PaaB [Ilumatobacteraceae bacterium]